MKVGPLWKLSVAITPEAEEAVTELLSGVFGQPASSYTDAETGIPTVSVYLKNRSDCSRPTRLLLEERLQWLATAGLELGSRRGRTSKIWTRIAATNLVGTRSTASPFLALKSRTEWNPSLPFRRGGSWRVTVTEVRRENWAESWKRHFKPLEIGRALLLKPSWSRRRSQPGQAVVVLDPGLSFGTGQHPTTRFCLEQLVACRSTGEPRSFLDVGTGSGILAIAAAKLDYGPVRALDCDPEAVRIARRNAKLNQVHTAVRVACQDLAQLSGRRSGIFDLVCANLIADVLLAHRSRLISLLSPHGRIVLAGILKSQFRPVQAAYEAAGLRLVNVAAAGEWKSGAFEMAPGCQGSRHPVHFGAGRTKKFHK